MIGSQIDNSFPLRGKYIQKKCFVQRHSTGKEASPPRAALGSHLGPQPRSQGCRKGQRLVVLHLCGAWLSKSTPPAALNCFQLVINSGPTRTHGELPVPSPCSGARDLLPSAGLGHLLGQGSRPGIPRKKNLQMLPGLHPKSKTKRLGLNPEG